MLFKSRFSPKALQITGGRFDVFARNFPCLINDFSHGLCR